MRKLILYQIILLAFLGCSKDDDKRLTQWESLTIPTNQTIIDIDFYNDNFGIAVVPIGNLLRTTDGGNSWKEISIVTDENFMSCYALSNEQIFVGRNRFFKSNDGGDNFKELGQDQIDYSSSIFGIYFYNSQIGVVLKGSSLYKTTDGGQNWTVKYPYFGSSSLMEVLEQTIYLAGGITFDNVAYGEMHKSIDGGDTWQKINLPTEIRNSQITAINFLTSDIGYISTFENKIFKTIDGGNRWKKISKLTFGIVSDMDFENVNSGYLTSNNKIYRTNDGGVTWTIDFESNEEVFYIERTPNNTVFVTGRNGVILRKNNILKN